MFGTTRVVGRQPYAPAAFVPGEIPGTHFQRLSRPQGTWFRRGSHEKNPQWHHRESIPGPSEQKWIPGIFPEGWRWPVRRTANLATYMCRFSWNLGASTSLNPEGLFRPVQWMLYFSPYMINMNFVFLSIKPKLLSFHILLLIFTSA